MLENIKFNFTVNKPQKLLPSHKNKIIFWDATTPGFGLRITKNGIKSYILQSRLNGKSLRLTIGPSSIWALKQAQLEARKLSMQIDRGIDFRRGRQKRKALES